jgi:hypothetical protein
MAKAIRTTRSVKTPMVPEKLPWASIVGSNAMDPIDNVAAIRLERGGGDGDADHAARSR